MKKAFFLAGLCFLLLSCGGASNSSSASTRSVISSLSQASDVFTSGVDERGYETITHSDIIEGHQTIFHRLPITYDAVSSQPGMVESLEYQTTVYGDTSYSKHVNVYLPYGYNPDDEFTRYNILYFQHGNNQTHDNLVSPKNPLLKDKIMLDNLFDPSLGGISPCIVVLTTFYLTSDHTTTGLAGDNGVGAPANFYLEVRRDILPAVESHYNGYAKGDVSDENLCKTRPHRAFSGYSRGSMNTWIMMIKNLDYFQCFLPMSAPCTKFGEVSVSTAPEEAWVDLKATLDAHTGMPFYLYGASGNITDIPQMRVWMAFLAKQTTYFTYGENPIENNLCYTVSDYDHADQLFPYYYYNTLKFAFIC